MWEPRRRQEEARALGEPPILLTARGGCEAQAAADPLHGLCALEEPHAVHRGLRRGPAYKKCWEGFEGGGKGSSQHCWDLSSSCLNKCFQSSEIIKTLEMPLREGHCAAAPHAHAPNTGGRRGNFLGNQLRSPVLPLSPERTASHCILLSSSELGHGSAWTPFTFQMLFETS